MFYDVKKSARAIIFARVSTNDQKNGHSLDAQVSRLQAYCKKKNLEVVKEFQLVESSTCGEREQFCKLIDFINEQENEVILVIDAIDRLQRSFREVPVLEKLRISGKISIHFLRENQVLDKKFNSAQLMGYQMFIIMATICASSISDNVKRGIQHKLQKGEWIGKAPFGYRSNNAVMSLDIKESSIVKRIFEIYATNTVSISDISKIFNIQRSKILYILNNRFYYGVMAIKGCFYKHKYDTIISEELFNKCQEIIVSKKVENSRKPLKIQGDF